MPTKRPGSVTAAAVMSIVYGSLFTVCGLCGLAALALQSAGNNLFAGGNPQQEQFQKQVQDALERDAPAYQAVQVGGTILGLFEAIAMLIAGIGLLGMNGWARLLALITAVIAMASGIFQIVYALAFIIPTANEAMQRIPAPANAGPQGGDFIRVLIGGMYAATVVFHIVWIIYMLIILLLLRRRNVRAAFAASGLSTQVDERFQGMQKDEGWAESGERDQAEDEGRYR